MLRYLFALALLLIAPAALAQPQVTADEARAIQLAVNRGTLLYYYDQAAWHGTDDMLTKIGGRQGEIGGWIVDGPADASELIFYDKNTADPHAIYIARFDGVKLVSGRVLGPSDDRTISAGRQRMIAALAAAREGLVRDKAEMCVARNFNSVVLPPETPGDATLVYFLTPQTDNDILPFGKHYSFAVSADGKAGKMRRFTNICIALPTRPKDGGEMAALTISHLLDPTPTEIHVFSMLAIGKPIFVITGKGRVWAVEASDGKARITLLDPAKLKKD